MMFHTDLSPCQHRNQQLYMLRTSRGTHTYLPAHIGKIGVPDHREKEAQGLKHHKKDNPAKQKSTSLLRSWSKWCCSLVLAECPGIGCRSKRGLEEWRNQAKLQQIEASQHEPVLIPSSVPYATQVEIKPELTHNHAPKYKPGDGPHHQKVEKYKTRLEEKRKQVGLITQPSSELQQAEKCLAEVRHGCLVWYVMLELCYGAGHGHAGRTGG